MDLKNPTTLFDQLSNDFNEGSAIHEKLILVLEIANKINQYMINISTFRFSFLL